MEYKGEFELVRENGIVRIKKLNYNFTRDSGTSILGWIDDRHRTTWCNYLNGILSSVNPVEERNINPDHISLYCEGKMIGWIDRKRCDDIEDALWKYLKTWRPEKKQEQRIEPVQLSLF